MKKAKWIFPEIFFHKIPSKAGLPCLELVYSKSYLIFQKYFYEVIQNVKSTECNRLEKKSVIKFLVAENCKLCEIYRRMCDAYREACFSQKKFMNRLNMGLLLWAIVHWLESHWLSGKKKFQTQQSEKKNMLTVFWDMKNPITIDFSWKKCNCKQCFLLPTP